MSHPTFTYTTLFFLIFFGGETRKWLTIPLLFVVAVIKFHFYISFTNFGKLIFEKFFGEIIKLIFLKLILINIFNTLNEFL